MSNKHMISTAQLRLLKNVFHLASSKIMPILILVYVFTHSRYVYPSDTQVLYFGSLFPLWALFYFLRNQMVRMMNKRDVYY
ncbi:MULTISPECIES: hypothetical protein [unclassified Fusibacter]|uniref:hypothetical protein n=1 Tax=unclassified Fusibacter TaxID=2624464 RepID=UPI0010117BB9|nr:MULTISPECIES: hypothetical protein [unclassified Fusibacter]MCK8060963.1 hypothetical protein [Fusibacter sp. A2]NPE23259.1 hypothetical protein [Fusibacter sp. A1]RXV59612.1 hypothetical protein DWB64_15610 [Fusibacter sp. A1]